MPATAPTRNPVKRVECRSSPSGLVRLCGKVPQNRVSVSSHLRSSFVTAQVDCQNYDHKMQVRSAKPKQTRQLLANRRRATVVPIESRITILGHQKIILDSALAEIYGVPVKRLNQQVNRNRSRFPADFMFRLKPREFAALRLQFATSKKGRGGRRSLPYAFTEHGAIMAATVLNSEQAVEMSVFVVRAFVRVRAMLAANKELADKIEELEKHMAKHDGSIQEIVRLIKRLMEPLPPRRSKIGFALPSARTRLVAT
jgi:ORF6N domain